MPKYKYILKAFIVSLMVVIGAAAPAVAATEARSDSLQAVAQSYAVSEPLQQGLIVQIDDTNKTRVTPASYKDTAKMLGVVVSPNDSPVTLSGDDTNQQRAYVVTTGRYNVLVSNQNGGIAAGDYVSISSINGIGMKADDVQKSVLGRAVGSFNGSGAMISNTTLKLSNGQSQKVNIGMVAVDINIAPNPQRSGTENGVPKVVQNFAVNLVGKPITAMQLYASIAILLVGLGIVGALLYSGVKTGMSAIGRNPLARRSIMRNMMQVIITSFIIFIGCLIAVYLILKI